MAPTEESDCVDPSAKTIDVPLVGVDCFMSAGRDLVSAG